MEIRIHKPSPLLAGYIKYYWVLESHSVEHTELVYPTGEIQMLFHCGEPFTESAPGRKGTRQPRFTLCGQRINHSDVKNPASCYTIGLVFYPWAASLFFPFSLDSITGYSVDLSDIYRDWKDYDEKLLGARDDFAKITVVEQFLLEKISDSSNGRFALVKEFVCRINARKGIGPLNELYKNFEVSEKTMQRLFRQFVGLTPKMYSEFVQVHNSVTLLKQNTGYAALSCQAGYYDQAHFIKKLKTYTGCTPSELTRKCPESDVVFVQ